MTNNGIMAEIKDLLHQGLSSREIIAKGYAASTVYRVQSNVRGRSRHARTATPMLVTFDPEYQAERAAEAVHLRQKVAELETQLTDLAVESERLRTKIQEIETTIEEAKDQGQRSLDEVSAVVDKIDGELDDLAKVYEDNKNLFSDPAWQRRSR
jgi:chromosome segregation ATPase